MAEVSAPFLLGVILEHMRTPADYWSVIADYRQRFEPLRRQVVRDREKWAGRSGQYLQKALAPLNSADVKYERSIDGTAIVASAVATAIRPDVLVAGAGIKLARAAFPAERVRRAFYRRFRPALHLLFSLADEAKELTAVHERIAAIWGRDWSRDEHDLLVRLATAQAPDFARLRSLE